MSMQNTASLYARSGCMLLLLAISSVIDASTLIADPDVTTGWVDSRNRIEEINVSAAQGNKSLIKIALKQPLASLPVGVTLSNPARIYFDFPDTVNALGKSTQSMGEEGLRSYNVIQAGNRTRLVLNLSRPAIFDARIENNTLFITLDSAAAETGSASTHSRFTEPKSDTGKLSLQDIDFRRGTNGEGRIQVDLSKASARVDVRQQGKNLIVEFAGALLPKNLERRLDVTDFATPVQTIETFAQGENVRMIIEPKGTWEHAAYQSGNRFVVEVKPAAGDADGFAGGKNGQGAYKGDKLSLNFQNVEVRAVLQVIADFTGLNIITSDTVTGNLSLRLKDVPWDQALDIILQAKGLGHRQVGNVIMIAPRDEIAAKEKLDLESRQQITDLEPIRTESFQLNYQKAEEIRSVLSDANQKMLTKRGSVAMDARTNTLFVRDTPSQLEEVRKLIRKIDVSVRQVMIEARIVEASDTFSRNLGARFGVQNSSQAGGGFNLGTSGNLNSSSSIASAGGGVGGGGNLNVNLPAAGIASVLGGPAALGLSLIKFNNGTLINLELSALQSDQKGRIIASPRVVTADQVEATIEQGTEIPFQQATSSGATSIAFKKASLSLKVKPQITPDDNVIMTLNISQNTRGQDTPAGPSINTKQVQTQVLVENGGTVVIGGIFSRTENDLVNKVPFLGDVPILGNIFKNNAKKDDKTELLVFVTPRILKDSLNLR